MSADDEGHTISEFVEARHHRAEIVFGVLSFGAALLLLTVIPGQTKWIAGQPLVRQPAFWPIVSIVGMTLFGTFELIFSWARNRSGRGETIAGEVGRWLKAAEYILWFMAYVWLVPLAGYLPSTLLFCLTLTLRIGYRETRVLVASLGVGLATVVIFKSLLAVKIPGGAVYEFLPPVLRNFLVLYL